MSADERRFHLGQLFLTVLTPVRVPNRGASDFRYVVRYVQGSLLLDDVETTSVFVQEMGRTERLSKTSFPTRCVDDRAKYKDPLANEGSEREGKRDWDTGTR